MFALEISFSDGVSNPEMILVRRPQAILGASDISHVVLEDMRELGYEVQLVRELSRRFRCKPTGSMGDVNLSTIMEGVYDGEALLDLGPVQVHVTALDIDLLVKDTEPPDRAGVRVLRQVCSERSPRFPAVVVPGVDPMVISFVPDQPVYVGRSNQCEVRLDSSDVSSRHARIGYESGQFWIEDLGSTNGTFVGQQQISGRVNVAAGEPIIFGRDMVVMGVVSEEQIALANSVSSSSVQPVPQVEQSYPALISVSEVARPARVVVHAGQSVAIGRDPGSDIWLGAPHISRHHLTVEMTKTGAISVLDSSTNGTMHDAGRMRKGDILDVGETARVFNFGGGITLGLCFDEDEESSFIASGGAPHAFTGVEGTQVIDPAVGDLGTQVGGFDPHANSEITGTNTFHNAGKIYKRLKFTQKLLLVLFVVVIAVVITALVNIVMGLL